VVAPVFRAVESPLNIQNNSNKMKSVIPYFTLGILISVLSCQQPAMPGETDARPAQIMTVHGLVGGEKATAMTGAGQLVDINSRGEFFVSGTSLPATISGMPEVVNPPEGKTCSVMPELLEGSDSPGWVLVCSPLKFFTIGGVVTGLPGKPLKLQLNDFPPVTIAKNGRFTLPRNLAENTPYELRVAGQPGMPGHLCAVHRGLGVVAGNVNDIEVVCSSDVFLLGGSARGQKSGLTLKNANGDIVSIGRNDHTFHFSQFIPAGADFSVAVENQPWGQECYIENAGGTNIRRSVQNILVVCEDVRELVVKPGILKNDARLAGEGTILHLWFYLDRNQVVYPTLKKTVAYVTGKGYTIMAPVGTFYVRAFIDVDGDERPGIGEDIQSRLLRLSIQPAGPLQVVEIPLESTLHASGFEGFNAYVFNTAEWLQPRGGKCGGVYLRLESKNFRGNKNHISPVYVILPDKKTVELLDDGGCGDSFNNNASSYDRQSGDGQVSAGIDRSYGIQAGSYTFFYVNYLEDKVHVFEDTVTNVLPLSSLVALENPTGALAVQTPNPVFRWSPIGGASSYEILLESTDHSINNYLDPRRFVNANSYVAPFDLLDQKAYKVNIQAFDADITDTTKKDGLDFDAVSQGPDQFFIADFSGNHSVKVSGRLTNTSGGSGSYLIYGDGNVETGSWESSVFLPADSQTYSLALFRNSGKFGAMISGINVDDSGYLLSSVNRAYVKWNQGLGLADNLLLDLAWNKPLLLIEPAAGQSGQGEYPVFSWESFPQNSSSPWSYILWVTPWNSHGAPRLVGLENNRIDFRYVNSAGYRNLSSLYQCTLNTDSAIKANSINKINNGKKYGGQTFSACGYEDNRQPGDASVEGLKEQTEWEWKVMIVPCKFQDERNFTDIDLNGRSDYVDCLLKVFSGEKPVIAESVSNLFSTY